MYIPKQPPNKWAIFKFFYVVSWWKCWRFDWHCNNVRWTSPSKVLWSFVPWQRGDFLVPGFIVISWGFLQNLYLCLLPASSMGIKTMNRLWSSIINSHKQFGVYFESQGLWIISHNKVLVFIEVWTVDLQILRPLT